MHGNKILAGPQPELMAMHAQGKKTFEIADALYVSPKTVSRWQKEQGLDPIRGPVHKISPAKAEMTLTINMADGNNHRFEGRDGDEVFRKIEDADGQFVKFRSEKYKCLINREYIVSIVVWED